jgi:nicotinate-nucleotide adenylyltransferase
VIGLLGGTFDPPHNGHVELARGAVEHFRLEPLVVLVVVDPGHKRDVVLDAETRLELARAAFPAFEVELEEHAFTVDSVRGGRFGDAVFVIGADEFVDFPHWKDPEGVLAEVRLGVATRPGYPRERFDAVLEQLSRPERVAFFEIAPVEVASRDVRRRLAAGEPVDGLVPPPVARLIDELGLYRGAIDSAQSPG